MSKAPNQTVNKIVEQVKEIFPGAIIMFIYYCGSYAYDLDHEGSDRDLTVVLDGFEGSVHLSLDNTDLFVYGREFYNKKQALDQEIPVYDRSYIDEVLSKRETLIYLDDYYKKVYESYKNVEMTLNLEKFLEGFTQYYDYKLKSNVPEKTFYHLFKMRGILDNLDETGIYELVVDEPWHSMMVDYKRNWHTTTGLSYMPLLIEQLNYIKTYKRQVIRNELG